MLPNFSYFRGEVSAGGHKGFPRPRNTHSGGGTDLLGCLRDQVFPADRLVSISRLTDLKGISKTADGGLQIGALTTITEVAESR